jgi:DNA polymerase family A
MLWLDFETRSECDLRKHGVYNYAQDATTDVLCMSYAFDDDEVRTWTPDMPFPEAVRNYKGQIYAHNATFERLIFWYVLQINFDLTQFVCTAAQARANCAPGSLEDVGRFSGSSMRKDHRGAQLIRLLCVPPFRNDPELMQELIEYCEMDVKAMRAISKAMRPLSEQELQDYHVNERINDRGVLVDVPLCRAAIQYASDEVVEIQQIVTEVTEGAITSVRSPKMKQWVLDRVGPQAKELMVVYKDGEKKYSIDKAVRANLILMEDPDEIPPAVAEVIQCADDLWASSVAKFSRLADLADIEDSRVRGAFVFAGGSATGRASSYGAQVHNFTRRCAEEPDAVRTAMVRGHSIVPKYGKRVTDVLKGMLRPALVPAAGKHLVVADWAAIEARANPWLSGVGDQKLDLFRTGADVYKVNAAATFGVVVDKVDKEQRQIGKVQELACLGPYTQVLTNNGYKAIVEVLLTDLLWDGQAWVTHQGVISKGFRQTINVCGVEVTPDHLIKTPATWVQAQQLDSNKQLLTQALGLGSDNLPYWAPRLSTKVRVECGSFVLNAIAELSRIWFIYTTFSKAPPHDALSALKKRLASGEKIFSSMPMRAQMMATAGAYSIGYPLARTGAITQKTETTQTMARAAYKYTCLGVQTKPLFYDTLWSWMAGTNRILNLIASTSTKAMNLAICGLSPKKKTATTNARYKKCSGTSLSLRPVFDILNSGPRNSFTVLTNQGHLIVHNCGFAGGVGAFAAMGRAYGVLLPESDARRMVDGWRRANPWAPTYWQALESAYLRAMRNKGHEFKAGRVTYYYDGVHLWYMLPSGRVLNYPFAKFDAEGNVTYAKAAWKPAADAKEWPRARLWKGLACENITQAAANDLLRHSLRHLDDVVLHVHDEIVIETSSPDEVVKEMKRIMCTPPDWATGLPLDVEVQVMTRYGK